MRRLGSFAVPVVATAAAVAIAGCGGASAPSPSSRFPAQTGSRAAGAPAGSDLRSASEVLFQRQIRRPWTKTDFSKHVVPLRQFERGGPPPDGIPPLDRPRVTTIAAADRYLTPRDPVIAVSIRGHARAYPLRILVWHEIANDVLGQRPIAVTYCPLCNSALVYDRRVGGRVLRFGTTGVLRGSDLVMWDRRTQSWWQQIGGRALVGAYAGTRLRPIAAETLSWAQFKRRYPHGDVLSERTRFDRPYGTNPYLGYDAPGGQPLYSTLRTDPRLPALERVAAVSSGGRTIVAPFSALARQHVVQARVGSRPIAILYDRRVLSVLDAARIADSREVGTAAAFDRRMRDRALDFAPAGPGRFTDRQTGSAWDLTGRAVSGPLAGAHLRPLRTDDQFWFGVAAFYPRARLVR